MSEDKKRSIDESEPSDDNKGKKKFKVAFNVLDLITEPSWINVLSADRDAGYMVSLSEFVDQEFRNGPVFPPKEEVFAAINNIPFDKVKVVILGQDPYIFSGQANGLCFSVHKGIKIPPSLENILAEVRSDTGVKTEHGDLFHWTEQGVLLLNTIMTVRKGAPLSHAKKGWEHISTRIIQQISRKLGFVVFLLWGGKASEKANLIDKSKHLILEASHPSPKSAESGKRPFVGCKHFSATNKVSRYFTFLSSAKALEKHGLSPIDWSLTHVQ